MKRLRFKKPFEGLTQTLQLIPESYRVNGKTFEITDGNDSYRIKWDNNKPTIIETEEKNTVDRLTSLMEYDSKKTLGNVIGEGRINENDVFKKLLKEDFRNVDLNMEEEPMEQEPMGMGPGAGMQDGSGPGDGQGMGMEPHGLGGVEHGMDPMPMEMDTDAIITAAMEIIKGAVPAGDERADNLLSALNQYEGDIYSTNEFGDEMMGPETVDGVPGGSYEDEYSDEMISDPAEYGKTELNVDDEEPIMDLRELDELSNIDEEYFLGEGIFTDLLKKKTKVATEDQTKEELSVDILKGNPGVGQYPIQKACDQVGMKCPPIKAMDTGFFAKLYGLLDNSNIEGVNSRQLMTALIKLDENKQK